MRWISFTTVVFAALSHSAIAANLIDPNGLGATDVVDLDLDPFPTGNPTLLTNPLTDPLNLGTHILTVGYVSSGELRIDGGSNVVSNSGIIGYLTGSTGVVTVDGVGSTWTNSGSLFLGSFLFSLGGDGALNITGGGTVSNTHGIIGTNADSKGVVTVDGNNSSWTCSGDLDIGSQGADGTLTITGGGTVSNAKASIAPTGAVTVGGAGSTWTSTDDLFVQSMLNIQGGAEVSNHRGYISTAGIVTVDGVGSVWTSGDDLDVADGTLNITGGGAVSSVGGSLGYYSGQTAAVTVDGAGSKWTGSDTIIVGRYGDGTLNITGGATVESSSGSLGYRSGATGVVTIDGIGSTWSTGSLSVGISSGIGMLTISNGAAVNAEGSTSAGEFGSITFDDGTLTTATLSVDSEDLLGTGAIYTNGLISDIGDIDLVFDATHGLSRTIQVNSQPGQDLTVHLDVNGAGSMAVGYHGSGSMNISDGVEVQTRSGYVGLEAASTGVVTVDGPGSTWTTTGHLTVGGQGAATLTISGGATVSSSSTTTPVLFLRDYVGLSDGSSGHVTVDGDGSKWSNRDLSVGIWGQGTLTITNGGLVSVAGMLTIDRDLDGNGFVNIATGGMLALEGDADDSLAQFLDLVEGTDAIRYWDDSVSDWADIAAASYGDDYTLEYLTTGDLLGYTLLTVGVSTLPGDYNGDGVVDAADYTVWRDNLGSNVTLPGDTTLGTVTSADYDVWRSNYGATQPVTGTEAQPASTPEPASLLLVCLALTAISGFYRGRCIM